MKDDDLDLRRTRGAALLILLSCGLGAGCRTEATGYERARAQRATRVTVATVERGDLVAKLRYTGELQTDAIDLAAKVAGQVVDIAVRIGDTVKQGAILARIDDAQLRRRSKETQAELTLARASREQAKAKQALAQRHFERTAPLERNKLVSPQELDDVRTAAAAAKAELDVAGAQVAQAEARMALLQQQLADTRLVAPFDAVIAERRVDPGAFAQVGTVLLRLVRAGALRVLLRIPERDLRHVKPGLAIRVTTQASGRRAFAGSLRRLAGEVTRSDRTVAAEAELTETDPLLRPGMYAEIQIDAGTLRAATLLPAEAVITRTDDSGRSRRGVMQVVDNHARWRAIEVLGREGDRVAVKAGAVAVGDRVIVVGHQNLADGSQVRVLAVKPALGDRQDNRRLKRRGSTESRR